MTSFWLGLLEVAHPVGIIAGSGGDGVWFGSHGYDDSGEPTGAIGKVAPVGPVGTTPTPTLEVELTASEFGRVTSSPAGISCSGICSSQFPVGTAVTLTATADSDGYVFDGHLGVLGEEPCPAHFPALFAPSAPCQYTVSGDARYSVEFGSAAELEEETPGGDDQGGGGGGAASTSSPSPSAPVAAPPPALKPGPKPKPKAHRCRKGFKRQRKNGSAKCVKVKKKERRYQLADNLRSLPWNGRVNYEQWEIFRMAEVPNTGELEAALNTWLSVFDEDAGRSVNEAELLEMLADTLGDDSGEAKVKSAQVVSLENVVEFGDDFRVDGTFNLEAEHRTNSDDPDTFGPNDLTDWKQELLISAVHQEGEWRVTDVRLPL